ncbi:hypothetical protein Tco_0505546 [Tanacetum coccineum]
MSTSTRLVDKGFEFQLLLEEGGSRGDDGDDEVMRWKRRWMWWVRWMRRRWCMMMGWCGCCAAMAAVVVEVMRVSTGEGGHGVMMMMTVLRRVAGWRNLFLATLPGSVFRIIAVEVEDFLVLLDDLLDDDEESTIPLNEIISQIPPSIAITPVLPIMEPEDSLNMGDEHLSTIPKKESDQEVVEDIESVRLLYVSNLDEEALLVTNSFKLNEDECFVPQRSLQTNFLSHIPEVPATARFLPKVETNTQLASSENQSSSHKSYAPTSKASLPTRANATTRHKGKEIAKPITPPPELTSDEDSDPVTSQMDKEMLKNFGFSLQQYLSKKEILSNLPATTSELPQTPETKMWILLQGMQEVKNGLKTPRITRKRCCCGVTAEKGVQLQVEQSDWLADMDKEIDEQELEAHYRYMENIQEVPNADSSTDSEPLEQTDQNAEECDDERVALANLIANLKLDVDGK